MVLTYPLITLSTRSQVESKRAHSTVLDATRRIIQREGISGLYAGLDSAVFGISVTNFVYYYCLSRYITTHSEFQANFYGAGYEWSRATFEKAALKAGRSRAKLTTLEAMAAGALAGTTPSLPVTSADKLTKFRFRNGLNDKPYLGGKHPYDRSQACYCPDWRESCPSLLVRRSAYPPRPHWSSTCQSPLYYLHYPSAFP